MYILVVPCPNNLLSLRFFCICKVWNRPEAMNLENSFLRVFNEVVIILGVLCCKRFTKKEKVGKRFNIANV